MPSALLLKYMKPVGWKDYSIALWARQQDFVSFAGLLPSRVGRLKSQQRRANSTCVESHCNVRRHVVLWVAANSFACQPTMQRPDFIWRLRYGISRRVPPNGNSPCIAQRTMFAG